MNQRGLVALWLTLVCACGSEPDSAVDSGAPWNANAGSGGAAGTSPSQDAGAGMSDARIADSSSDADTDDAGVDDGGDGGGDAGMLGDGGADNALYHVAQPIEVAVDIAAADWEVLRKEGRNMPLLVSGCDDPNFTDYSVHPAQVTIAGELLPNAEVRKKGYLGSISVYRPSLRIDVGSGDSAMFHGQKHVTLNNNRQDHTNAHQCVTYGLFKKAGLHAPRCGLAHVTVNGVDKGHYSVVEPIEKAFLMQEFGDGSGNLYESTLPADFTAQRVGRYELKTNNKANDRSDLDRVLNALKAPDDGLFAKLDEVFDLDELITFWALETLVGHTDGLSRNLNNAYLYHDPTDDRFHPIVWGADQTLSNSGAPGEPHAVFAKNALCARLYAYPLGRKRYQDRMRELLMSLWDEDAIMADIHVIAMATGVSAADVSETEAAVRGQRNTLETELMLNGGLGPDPVTTDFVSPTCKPPTAAQSAVDFTWDASPTAYKPILAINMSVPVSGGNVAFVPLTLFQLAAQRADGAIQMGVAGNDATSQRSVFVGLIMPPESYHTGVVEFHGFETFGVVAADATASQSKSILTFIGGNGTITFDQAGTTTGAAVKGSWQAQAAVF
jgi:spore coat protein H